MFHFSRWNDYFSVQAQMSQMLENHLIKNSKVPAKQQNGFSD